MELLLFILTFLFCLIISNAINKLAPRIPVPLIQILLGMGLGLLLETGSIRIDTEIFLALIIGPLLFREAEESDITSILKHWRIIIFLIFPVIFVSTLALGRVAQAMLVGLPLAACLAVGAALGPTDLVAFSSLSERFSFPKRIENILKGEGLLNDASGLVAFQVAVAALTTGAFSLSQASSSLVLSILGGIVIGLLTALVNRGLHNFLLSVKASDIASELLLELSLPLMTFFLAEEIHVSGIIAVVVAGILKASRFKKITLLEAQVDTVTETVWRTVTFMLNGSVFLLLGVELVNIVEPIVKSPLYDNFLMLLVCLVLTLVLFAIRFLMIFAFYGYRAWKLKKKMGKTYLNDILILTFSGVKGTVSIATVLLLPTTVKESYPLLLFLVAGVTLLSFLTGILVLPKLSQSREEKSETLMHIAILNDVVTSLEAELPHTRAKGSLYAAIDNYHGRIAQLIIEQESSDSQRDWAELQMLVLSIENDGLEQAAEEEKISPQAYRVYQRYLRGMEKRINRNFASRLTYVFLVGFRLLRLMMYQLLTLGSSLRTWLKTGSPRMTREDAEAIAELYLANTEVMMDSLENLKGVYQTSMIDFLQESRIRETAIIGSGAFIDRVIMRLKPNNIDEMMYGYYLERKLIFEYEKEKLISAHYAKYLRQNVNNLENYSLKEKANTLPYDMLNYARGR